MKNQEKCEEICLGIISPAGSAKSSFLEAIELAKEGEDWETAYQEGLEQFKEAAQAHASALQREAEGEMEFGLLLIHAETILCSAETIRDLSSTIIELVTAKK